MRVGLLTLSYRLYGLASIKERRSIVRRSHRGRAGAGRRRSRSARSSRTAACTRRRFASRISPRTRRDTASALARLRTRLDRGERVRGDGRDDGDPLSGRKNARLREDIQRELSSILEFEGRDPVVREAFPTVMDVRLSVDGRYAKVYVAVVGDVDREALEKALAQDRGFYRSMLAESAVAASHARTALRDRRDRGTIAPDAGSPSRRRTGRSTPGRGRTARPRVRKAWTRRHEPRSGDRAVGDAAADCRRRRRAGTRSRRTDPVRRHQGQGPHLGARAARRAVRMGSTSTSPR